MSAYVVGVLCDTLQQFETWIHRTAPQPILHQTKTAVRSEQWRAYWLTTTATMRGQSFDAIVLLPDWDKNEHAHEILDLFRYHQRRTKDSSQ